MRVEERFLKYVSFGTNSDENSASCPSTMCQKELTAYLEEEMKAVGLSGVKNDGTGYVYGILPASKGCEDRTPIGFVAHIDTSGEVPGDNIKPRVIEYEGGDIDLGGGVVTTRKVFPYLDLYKGQHLIITDGTTLLGADDKAGIAEIMTAIEDLIAHPEIEHGTIYVCFNPDEEIGRGMERVDLSYFKPEYAYTVDGGRLGELEYECFNAAAAKIHIKGVSIHPGSSKNKMKNAVLIANEYINMLPPAETQSHTEMYEGFYHVNNVEASTIGAKLVMIIRDHDRTKFEARKEFVLGIGEYLNKKYGEGTVTTELSDTYYNMREKLEDKMYIVEKAEKAMRELGIEPISVPIRGGTDGAALSFMGLPCPNLSTGGENCHGVHEFVAIESMEKMVEVIKKIAQG